MPGAFPITAASARCSWPMDWATARMRPKPRSRRCGCFTASTAIRSPPCSTTSMAACARRAARPCRSRASIRAAKKIVFSGIGNVAGMIVAAGETKRMVSMPGTAGHNARKIQSFDYPFEHGLVDTVFRRPDDELDARALPQSAATCTLP